MDPITEGIAWIIETIIGPIVGTLASWLLAVVSVPLYLLDLVTSHAPSCTAYGLGNLSEDFWTNAAGIVGWMEPVLSWLPIETGFQMFAAWILYQVVKVAIRWLPIVWQHVQELVISLVDFFWPF